MLQQPEWTGALQFSRRSFLLASAAVAGAAALPQHVMAATDLHTFQHGDFEITVMTDGHLVLPASVLAPNNLEELAKILEMEDVANSQVEVPTNPVLIRAGSDLILFDNGSGSDFAAETAGRLQSNLEAAGVAAGDITKVVFTHAHPDHCYATLTGAGLRYPNASHHVVAGEWDFWMDPDLKSKMPEGMHAFVDGAQKHLGGIKDTVTMLKPGDEVVAGIRVLDTAGHTPGHASFEVAGDEGLIIVGDAIAAPPVFFPHPDWHFGFDAVPDLAVQNRTALLDRAATDKIKMIGYHWPYPGVGYAERKDNAYRYVPAT